LICVVQWYKHFLTSSLLNIHSAVAKLFDVYKQFTKTDIQSKAMYLFFATFHYEGTKIATALICSYE